MAPPDPHAPADLSAACGRAAAGRSASRPRPDRGGPGWPWRRRRPLPLWRACAPPQRAPPQRTAELLHGERSSPPRLIVLGTCVAGRQRRDGGRGLMARRRRPAAPGAFRGRTWPIGADRLRTTHPCARLRTVGAGPSTQDRDVEHSRQSPEAAAMPAEMPSGKTAALGERQQRHGHEPRPAADQRHSRMGRHSAWSPTSGTPDSRLVRRSQR